MSGNFIDEIVQALKPCTVYALVGESGTGKSFRSKLLAEKYGIDSIIDDGLLIQNDKICAADHLSDIFFVVVLRRFFEKALPRTDEGIFYSVIVFEFIFHIKIPFGWWQTPLYRKEVISPDKF